MKTTGKQRYRAYRFTLTAVSVGETADDALERLLGALSEDPTRVLDEDITFEELDYLLVLSGDAVAEA
jgi:hypothetical protein